MMIVTEMRNVTEAQIMFREQGCLLIEVECLRNESTPKIRRKFNNGVASRLFG